MYRVPHSLLVGLCPPSGLELSGTTAAVAPATSILACRPNDAHASHGVLVWCIHLHRYVLLGQTRITNLHQPACGDFAKLTFRKRTSTMINCDWLIFWLLKAYGGSLKRGAVCGCAITVGQRRGGACGRQ